MVEFGGLRRPDIWTTSPAIADLLRATTLLAQAGITSPAPAPQPEWKMVGPVAGTPLFRYERDPRLPEAFVAGGAARVTFDGALATIRNDPTVDPASLVLYEGLCRQCALATRPGVAGRAVTPVRWRERTARVAVQVDRPGVLVVSQAWSKGWRATVDGREVPVVRVYGLTMGVPVPAGRHDVRFRYDAPGLQTGLAVSIVTVMGLGLAIAIERRRRRVPLPVASGPLPSDPS